MDGEKNEGVRVTYDLCLSNLNVKSSPPVSKYGSEKPWFDFFYPDLCTLDIENMFGVFLINNHILQIIFP